MRCPRPVGGRIQGTNTRTIYRRPLKCLVLVTSRRARERSSLLSRKAVDHVPTSGQLGFEWRRRVRRTLAALSTILLVCSVRGVGGNRSRRSAGATGGRPVHSPAAAKAGSSTSTATVGSASVAPPGVTELGPSPRDCAAPPRRRSPATRFLGVGSVGERGVRPVVASVPSLSRQGSVRSRLRCDHEHRRRRERPAARRGPARRTGVGGRFDLAGECDGRSGRVGLRCGHARISRSAGGRW